MLLKLKRGNEEVQGIKGYCDLCHTQLCVTEHFIFHSRRIVSVQRLIKRKQEIVQHTWRGME